MTPRWDAPNGVCHRAFLAAQKELRPFCGGSGTFTCQEVNARGELIGSTFSGQ
jgi:hypothetical protein